MGDAPLKYRWKLRPPKSTRHLEQERVARLHAELWRLVEIVHLRLRRNGPSLYQPGDRLHDDFSGTRGINKQREAGTDVEAAIATATKTPACDYSSCATAKQSNSWRPVEAYAIMLPMQELTFTMICSIIALELTAPINDAILF